MSFRPLYLEWEDSSAGPTLICVVVVVAIVVVVVVAIVVVVVFMCVCWLYMWVGVEVVSFVHLMKFFLPVWQGSSWLKFPFSLFLLLWCFDVRALLHVSTLW